MNKRPLVVAGDLCYISLTQGQEAIIDATDIRLVEMRDWSACRRGKRWYAVGSFKHQNFLMHRYLLGLNVGDPGVDHRNGNGLDNRRENLRMATQSQNAANVAKYEGTSKYKGVAWQKRARKWQSKITVEGRQIHLGLFEMEIQAAEAYDRAALLYFGEFAKVNGN